MAFRRKGPPRTTEDPLFETPRQQLFRRVNALETHLADLEDRFRPIDQYIGETAREALGHDFDGAWCRTHQTTACAKRM